MASNGSYSYNALEVKVKSIKPAHNDTTEEKIYDYEEAIDLTGNGWYSRGLLTALSIGLLGMAVEMFGVSVVVTGCTCDFQLELWQQSIMLSVPFIGPIVMSIPWGYISDTRGRRTTLLIALWGSFVASFISAFSVHWIMLGVLKLISASFCSTVQSVSYTLLGESCSSKIRGFYMLIMTSVLLLFVMSYVVPGFFILGLKFTFDLGFIKFTPWRLLVIILAAPMAISASMLHFCYESPKFLVNAGREQQALEHLRKMWSRNGGTENEYPVRKVILQESAETRHKDVNIFRSFWQQIVPLFKPPLLWKILQLFFLTSVIYSINNSFLMWMPHILGAFTDGESSNANASKSLCAIITSISKTNVTPDEHVACSSIIHSHTLLSGITHGLVFAGITLAVSKLASRKKVLMISFLLIPSLSCLGAVFSYNTIVSLLLYIGMLMTNLCMGVLFAYYVDLFPTSYRGMAACLGVMMARVSALSGINLLGMLMKTNCSITFYGFSAYLLCGIFVAAYFLPPDREKKS